MAEALQGLAALTRKLAEIGQLNDKNMRAIVRAGIAPARAKAKELAPRSLKPHKSYKGNVLPPGYLSQHLRVVTTATPGAHSMAALLGPNKEAFYGTKFVEIGTSKMAPEPWLRPAFYQTREQQVAAMKVKLQKIIDKVAATGSQDGAD